jgi:competence protein ComEC
MVLLMPYLMYWFSEFNLLSIIFNIILIPLSGLILSVALLTAILSFLQGWVAQFLGWLVYWLVNIFLLILNWLENVSLNVNVFFFDSIVLVIIYYAVLLILVIDFYKKNKSLTINI